MVVIAAEGRTTDIPAVVVELVRRVVLRRIPLPDDGAVRAGGGIKVDDGDGVRLQQRNIAERFARRGHGLGRRAVEGWVGMFVVFVFGVAVMLVFGAHSESSLVPAASAATGLCRILD